MITNTVITFDGTEAIRRDCRFIKGEFYIKGKQCFLIDGVWYRINSNAIALDYSSGNYVLIKAHPELIKGIVGYDRDNNELIIGHFLPDLLENVSVLLTGKSMPMMAINYRVLPPSLFVENINGTGFRQDPTQKASDKRYINFGNNGYGFPLPYGFRHFPEHLGRKIKEGAEKHSYMHVPRSKYGILNELLRSSKSIIPYSFGLEFETHVGKIPGYRLIESGLAPLRDGSINGMEYVTIPLEGKMGLKILDEACHNLHKFTVYTTNESLHLHLGGVQTTKEYIGTLYTILAILEKEFYSMFPKYYAQTSKFKARGKDYNQPLRSDLVDTDPAITFSNIAFYLSAGKKYPGFGRPHPNDPGDEHKWLVEQRYSWVNFIPVLFGDNKTVEFRIHTPTDDINKVVNWILICSAVLKYTENFIKANKNLLQYKHLSLKTVINDVYDYKIASYLIDYVEERKKHRISMDTVGDFTGIGELTYSYKEFI